MAEANIDIEHLSGLNDEERGIALSILSDLSKDGKSKALDDLVYQDYDEIPVDIATFIHDKRYLGNGLTDPSNGRFTLFPYWEEKLKEIFPTNVETRYNTVILTGGIGLGKSTIAVICLLYMLYRLLCMKDPYAYYGMQPIDKITISLMNITIENAKGVAMDKMNGLIMSSEWFMAHGYMSGTENLLYHPEKHIEVITASSNNQVIGRCLDGNTKILTSEGARKLKDLEGIPFRVISIDENGEKAISNECTVACTAIEKIFYKIELEDGSVIECTPSHKLMLKDGSYKEAQFLTENDELFDTDAIQSSYSKIKSIEKVKLDDEKPFYDVINAYPYNNFLIKTNSGCICSHNCIYANFTDEVNFGLTNDVEKLKKKQKQLISQIDARMASRFQREKPGYTYLPTLNIIASSKNSEQSFLEDYIETKRKNNSQTTLIVCEPQWVVDSRKDSPKKFQVAIGNKFLANELLPRDCPKSLIEEYRAKGYQILDVPMGYREKFEDNLDGALMDIAGIATQASTKYISGMRWNEVKTGSYKNPFIHEVIEVGTAKDDIAQYGDFFDLSRVPKEMKSRPLFIHLDMSKSGDKTGIAGVWIVGKRPSQPGVEESKTMFFKAAFSVSIQAPKGYEISFDKNRTFIKWLKERGFNVRGVSSDTYQSTQIQQQLTADGFEVKTISMDRLDSETKTQLQYAYLKSTIYERRIEVYKDCEFLTEEVLGLERLSDGHIEHPEGGTQGSKDAIDSLCGALWNASQHSGQFAYEYGENLDLLLDINKDEGAEAMQAREQMTTDYEAELRQALLMANGINERKDGDDDDVFVL